MKMLKFILLAIFIPSLAFSMADSQPPVYGIPTLYGEYEISGDDVRRASNMYGVAPVSRPAPVRVGTAQKSHAAKHPVKPKKVTPKKKKAKQKPVIKQLESVKLVEKEQLPEPVVVAVVPVPVETKSEPVPSPVANVIAEHAADKIDVESFCIHNRPQGNANLPDGIILMPGRPDLMSCVGSQN